MALNTIKSLHGLNEKYMPSHCRTSTHKHHVLESTSPKQTKFINSRPLIIVKLFCRLFSRELMSQQPASHNNRPKFIWQWILCVSSTNRSYFEIYFYGKMKNGISDKIRNDDTFKLGHFSGSGNVKENGTRYGQCELLIEWTIDEMRIFQLYIRPIIFQVKIWWELIVQRWPKWRWIWWLIRRFRDLPLNHILFKSIHLTKHSIWTRLTFLSVLTRASLLRPILNRKYFSQTEEDFLFSFKSHCFS